MNADTDRAPAIRVNLGDAIWVHRETTSQWARVIGLALDGDDVLVTVEGSAEAIRLPAWTSVEVRRTSDAGDDADEESLLALGYAGDASWAGAGSPGRAIPTSTPAPAGPPTSGSLIRDPGLVGIYGGDLDHVMDAFTGHTADPEGEARRRAVRSRGAAEGTRAPGAPDAESVESDDVVAERMAGFYGGDLDSVVDRRT